MTSANSLIPYSESGHGDPVILLDWTPWETPTLANAFATRYRVINIVPPDSGRSAGSARDAAAAIADVANATGLDSYILIGVSLGANVAFRLALLNPDSVAALVLVSPTCVASVAPQIWKTPNLATNAMLAHPEKNAQPLPDPSRTELLAGLAEKWLAADSDAVSLLPSLPCATLAVFGQEDRLMPHGAGQMWKEQVLNCNVCYVYDAGHAVGVDRPDALVGVALDFAERRETYIVERRSSLINL